MSIYEGITNLSRPGELKSVGWNYAVLGFAFVADATSWITAFRQLLKQKRTDESFWESIRTSKDASVFIVFGEDTADLAGLLVAFPGVFVEHQLHSHYADVIASIMVGLILAIVAIFLVYKSLLIGEAADTEIVLAVQKIVQGHPAVTQARRPLSMQLSPEEVFLALDVQFKSDLPASELVKVIDELKERIRQDHASVGKIFIDIQKLEEKKDGQNYT